MQEALSSSESVWSTHKAVLPFSPARPFRRSLVSNLPYFMIQWDYKGEKGYGHVIEGVDDAPEVDADGDEIRGEVGEKGGGEFTRYVLYTPSLSVPNLSSLFSPSLRPQ